jgi:opacity protein-like surface antigen
MRIFFATLFCFLLCAANAAAQSTIITGRAKSVDVSLGYSYLSHPQSSSNRLGFNGLDVSATIGLFPRFSIRGDLGYGLAPNALGTPSHSGVLTYLAGPVFYPTTQRKIDTYVQALFGGARVSGPIPVNGGIFIGGYATGFAWAVGGGIDYRVTNSIALRTGVDYVRTTYFDPTLAMQGQNNFRATAAVVYLFGTRQRKRR